MIPKQSIEAASQLPEKKAFTRDTTYYIKYIVYYIDRSFATRRVLSATSMYILLQLCMHNQIRFLVSKLPVEWLGSARTSRGVFRCRAHFVHYCWFRPLAVMSETPLFPATTSTTTSSRYYGDGIRNASNMVIQHQIPICHSRSGRNFVKIYKICILLSNPWD